MNQHTPLGRRGSLLERAAEHYSFGLAPPPPVAEQAEPGPFRQAEPAPAPQHVREAAPAPGAEAPKPAPKRAALPVPVTPVHPIDRRRLKQGALIEPEAPVG